MSALTSTMCCYVLVSRRVRQRITAAACARVGGLTRNIASDLALQAMAAPLLPRSSVEVYPTPGSLFFVKRVLRVESTLLTPLESFARYDLADGIGRACEPYTCRPLILLIQTAA